jgi:hypothetical protein
MSRSVWGIFLAVNCKINVVSKFIKSQLAWNHALQDLNSIPISFLRHYRSVLVNIVLVSVSNKIGLYFTSIVFLNIYIYIYIYI